MRSAEINRRFLLFFQQHGHTLVASAPLTAADPSLLFVNAGMVPFKPFFLGEQQPPYRRAASIQKCVRTVDIEVVGTTSRHTTFFPMAGNFSFGDYFKETAIPLAWRLLTGGLDEGGYGFDPQRLWATVYHDDDEAYDLWTGAVGLPPDRVQRRGKEDNFWDMGLPGPCGPCSEIYYDRHPEAGPGGGPAADEERYLEVWNLVFMQYERGEGPGKGYPILGDLPGRNIDTGMGVERMAVLLQDVDNVFETDALRPVLDRASELTSSRYGREPLADVRLRVVADHIRTATMLIGDGVVPGNEGQGYVLRRLLRRVVRTARLLGAGEQVLGPLVARVRDTMAPSYPELDEQFDRIQSVAVAEEEAFLGTLRTGTAHFQRAVDEARAAGRSRLSGDAAFALHDTYGFPIELTLEMARDAGFTVDEAGFRRLMSEQRDRAKADARSRKEHADVSVYRGVRERAGPSEFIGYDRTADEAIVRGLVADGEPAGSAGAGREVEVVLDRTPFYAEAGGQLADEGTIILSGAELEVVDVQRPLPDLVVHRAVVRAGEVRVGAAGYAQVDVERRRAISRAHTATHLIHQAVRGRLGETAAQAGSLNAPGRLRFDFTVPGGVPAGVLDEVEDEVNRVLIEDLPVRAFVTSQAEASRIGALALFGEKYGDEVRVVEVGDYARELCGGTHALASGQLGLVKLLGESSIGAGVRRLEALVGLDAFRYLAREHLLVGELAAALHARPEELADRVGSTLDRLRAAEKELEQLRAGALLAVAPQVAGAAGDVGGVAVAAHEAPAGTGADELRQLALEVRGRLDPGRPAVVVVAAPSDGRAALVVAVNEAGRRLGLAAGRLVAEGAAALGGRGGGRDELAQGGGTRPEAVGAAIAAVRRAVAGRREEG
jgi:alanyl-tRNA synthetase